MRDNADQPVTRYGRTRVSRIRKRIDNVRTAIRDEGTPAIQDAWDELEQFLPFFMMKHEEERGQHAKNI